MPERPDPVAAADDEARALARGLLQQARVAALAVTDPADGLPGISRVAFCRTSAGEMVALVSSLAPHTGALRQNPDCALMVGEVGPKGDPLTHPRLMIKARAEFVARDAAGYANLRAEWLTHHPKAKLYVDFADFAFVRFTPVSALLNGGFARAFKLLPSDLV